MCRPKNHLQRDRGKGVAVKNGIEVREEKESNFNQREKKMTKKIGMLKKLGILASILASAGVAEAATVTQWDTSTVQIYAGPIELHSSYINTIYSDATFTNAIGGITWKEDDTQGPGLSVVTGDDLDGSNCIMSAGYNPYDGTKKQCSDPFQSSKRFKSLMYKNGEPTVLKFDVVDDGSVKTYRMLQKISNWTGGLVKDFTLEIGFMDANGNFIKSVPADGLGISSQEGVVYTRATGSSTTLQKDLDALFAHGLFGAPDKHHDSAGYFNPYVRADFALVAEEDRIVSAGISPSHLDMFGLWMTSPIKVYGMYWDADHLWYTDNILMANCKGTFNETTRVCEGIWETYRSQEGTYTELETGLQLPYPSDGIPKNVSSTLLSAWAADPWVEPAPIDDFANVNLNYFITLGSTAKWPTPGSFAVRFIPNAGTIPPAVAVSPLTVTSITAPTAIK